MGRALHVIRPGYPGGQVRERPPSTWAWTCGHGLARLRAGVEHHPVALVADPLGHRHLVSLGNDLVQQSGVGGRERGDVRVVLLRDYGR